MIEAAPASAANPHPWHFDLPSGPSPLASPWRLRRRTWINSMTKPYNPSRKPSFREQIYNQGWRIKWEQWTPGGKRVLDTPPLKVKLSGIPCLILFLGAIAMMACAFINQEKKWAEAAAGSAIAMWVGAIFAAAWSNLYAARVRKETWISVRARRIDSEIGDMPKINLGKETRWSFRLVCRFEFQGKEYTVVPDPSATLRFTTRQEVDDYLAGRIDADGNCTLWLDPANPSYTFFDQLPRMWTRDKFD